MWSKWRAKKEEMRLKYVSFTKRRSPSLYKCECIFINFIGITWKNENAKENERNKGEFQINWVESQYLISKMKKNLRRGGDDCNNALKR